MTRQIKTNCPFTLDEYKSLIKLAKKRFPFVSFADYKNHDTFVIWRHDVEYSTLEMERLAAIDTEEEISSMFFIQLHCNYYNFWDTANIKLFKEWIKNGHKIGLHFDCDFHGKKVFIDIEGLIRYEKEILENELETAVDSFAFHNPNEKTLKLQDNYAGLINAYNRDLFKSDIIYVSDSNGRWREKTIRDVLEDKSVKKVNINTHDTWWSNERIPQIEKLKRAFRQTGENMIVDYMERANIIIEDII
jgi:hypothetical protein